MYGTCDHKYNKTFQSEKKNKKTVHRIICRLFSVSYSQPFLSGTREFFARSSLLLYLSHHLLFPNIFSLSVRIEQYHTKNKNFLSRYPAAAASREVSLLQSSVQNDNDFLYFEVILLLTRIIRQLDGKQNGKQNYNR